MAKANGLTDVRLNESQLRALVEQILAVAASEGATDAEVSANEETGLGVTVRRGELETVEFNQDRGFGITVYLGNRKGSASTSDSSQGAIKETVRAALDIARYTQEDAANGLADPAELADAPMELDLYHPWPLSADEAQEIARATEAAAFAHDKRIVNSEGAEVSTHQSCRVYGNSSGFIGAYNGTRHGISCVVIAEDNQGMQRDYWYGVARNVDDVEDFEAIGKRAAVRAVDRLGARRAPTGEFPVLFDPQMATGLIGHLMGALSGGALYRKASFLLDSLDTQVLSDHISLAEDPWLKRGMGSSYFDGDGVATRANHFVRDGNVENYVLGTYSARRLGMQTTGNSGGVHNLALTGDTRSVAELVRMVGRGLLVTELMGQGVNGVTGDYSRGAAGFWIENGALAYPVEEATIAGNLKGLYKQIVAVGDDVDRRGNFHVPSILLERMTVAGVG